MDWNEFFKNYGLRILFSLTVIIVTVILTRLLKKSVRKWEKRKGASLHAKFISNILRVLL